MRIGACRAPGQFGNAERLQRQYAASVSSTHCLKCVCARMQVAESTSCATGRCCGSNGQARASPQIGIRHQLRAVTPTAAKDVIVDGKMQRKRPRSQSPASQARPHTAETSTSRSQTGAERLQQRRVALISWLVLGSSPDSGSRRSHAAFAMASNCTPTLQRPRCCH